MVRVAACFVSLGVMAATVSGCGKSPEEKLTGKWVGERAENVPEGQLAKATEWAKQASFEFVRDRMTVRIPSQEPRTGAFKVAKTENNKMTLSVHAPDQPVPTEAVLTLESEKTLRWDLGDHRSIVLVRAD